MMEEEIDEFENYKKTNKLEKQEPDPGQAEGMMEMAEKDIERVNSEPINPKSASYVFKNAYDVIRTGINSIMALGGWKPYSHTVIIALGRGRLSLDPEKVSKINKFRKLRNNIEYRAEKATEKEAEAIVELMNRIIPKLKEELEKRKS